MAMSVRVDDPLLAAACAAVGTHRPELIHRWRGTASYQVAASEDGAWWKVKTARAGVSDHLAHEADVYDLRARQGQHPGGRHGQLDAGVWLAVPWESGVTLWEALARARQRQDAITLRAMTLRNAHEAFAELGRWHDAGLLHGDVQPGNVVVAERAALIDLDYVHGADLALPYPYRGGMDHTTAPEVAQALLDTPEDVAVPLTQAAEIYSLGVSIRWAWTGVLPTAYRKPVGQARPDELLADIADGRRAPLQQVRPYAFSELEELIEAATTLDPAQRRAPAAS